MRLDTIRKASLLTAIVIATTIAASGQTARWLRTGVGAPGSGGFGAPPVTCRITAGYTEVYVDMVTASQYLCKNVFGVSTNLGTWQLVSGGGSGGGTGDVVGPSSSVDGEMVLFSGGTGKVIRRSSALNGYVKVASGLVSAAPIPASDLPTAAADGITKGVASFNAADFDASLGNVSIDYANGQAANASTKGFLTATDWTIFNNKASAALSNLSSVAINTTLASDTDNTDDLGTSSIRWRNLYLSGFVGDGSNNELLKFAPTGSAVNEFTVGNAATGSGPTLFATGNDTNVDINLTPKGAGSVKVNGTGTSSVGIGDTDNSNVMKITVASNLTTDRAFNIAPGDADRTITLTGDPTLVAGTMATLAGSETLTNKILTNPAITIQALTDSATISWNANSGNMATVTLGGNRTMAAPTNLKAGGSYSLTVTQDGTGTRTITWNSVFKWAGGTAPTLTSTAGRSDLITCISNDGTNLLCNALLDIR